MLRKVSDFNKFATVYIYKTLNSVSFTQWGTDWKFSMYSLPHIFQPKNTKKVRYTTKIITEWSSWSRIISKK